MSDGEHNQGGAEGKGLAILGRAIRQDAQGRWRLNDCQVVAKAPASKRPSLWLDNEDTQALVAKVAENYQSRNSCLAPVAKVKGGAAPGVYVVKELVYAYAMWISPGFHLHVIEAFDAMMSEAAKPPPPPLPDMNNPAVLRMLLLQELDRQDILQKEIIRQRDQTLRAIEHGVEQEKAALAANMRAEASDLRREKVEAVMRKIVGSRAEVSPQHLFAELNPRRYKSCTEYLYANKWWFKRGMAGAEITDDGDTGKDWTPTQRCRVLGYMIRPLRAIPGSEDAQGRPLMKHRTFFTPKGVAWFTNLWIELYPEAGPGPDQQPDLFSKKSG